MRKEVEKFQLALLMQLKRHTNGGAKMNFDAEKIRVLSDKLRAFSASLNSDEQVLLAAMLRLGGAAIEQRLLAQRPPAKPPEATGRPDVSKAFEEALAVGSGSTLVASRSAVNDVPVTIDVPPTSVGVGGPISISTEIDPEPVTITLPTP